MRWMVVILGLFLSGCYAHYEPRYQGPPPLLATSMAQVDAMVGVQQPAAYKVGFMGGCDSGYLSAGNTSYIFKKDTNRFDTDDVYKQGWNDGFNRCASGAGVTTGNYYYQNYYGYDYYYPGSYYSGFYYPGYYYAPGYSIWLGYYGYPRHRHYAHNHNYYYTPWYGGHRHRSGGKYYSGRRGYKGYGGDYYIGRPRGGGHYKGHKGGGGGHKGWSGKGGGGKGGGHKGGGGKGGGYWVR